MDSLVITSGHVVDPANGVDRVADVVVADGRIVGLDVAVPPGARVLDAAGAHVSPGWIDGHTHVFGDIGLDDPDTAGVMAGVTTLVDAGSSGSMTVDEFLARTARGRTDVRAVLYLDRRGIADTATIPTRVEDVPAVPVGELRQAAVRHGGRIVAVKTGIYADLGTAWTTLALAAAELVGLPLFVHIGNFSTHTSTDIGLMRDLLVRLRPGDVLTHCYTSQPGNLLDEEGALLPEALDAAARGVVFDLGHSGAGFDPEVARVALAAGLRPTTVSSDIAVINVRQRVRSLAHVLGRVAELGIELPELVRSITAAPAGVYGLPGGHLSPGAPADLTVFDVDPAPGEHGERFTVRATVRLGEVVEPVPDAAAASGNIRFRVLDSPARPLARDAGTARLLDRLADCLEDLPADGEVIQAVVVHLATEEQQPIDAAATAVRRAFADRISGNPPGWLLAELRTARGTPWVVERLRAAAVVATPEPDLRREAS
jgi:dihydroorotase